MSSTVIGLVMPWLSAFVLALAGILLPLAYAKGLAYLKARRINTVVYEAIGRAGAVAYTAFLATGRPVTDRTALAVGAAAGGAYLKSRIPDALAVSGVVTPEAMAELAGAEMGKLLALDPSVRVPAV